MYSYLALITKSINVRHYSKPNTRQLRILVDFYTMCKVTSKSKPPAFTFGALAVRVQVGDDLALGDGGAEQPGADQAFALLAANQTNLGVVRRDDVFQRLL